MSHRIHYPALDQMRTIACDIGDAELLMRFRFFERRLEAVQMAAPAPAPPTERTHCSCATPLPLLKAPSICGVCYGSTAKKDAQS